MAQKKFDGLVEVVRYLQSGVIDCVRVYERRGPTFTDRILLDRETFLVKLKEGKKYVTGRRVPQFGSTFEVDEIIKVANTTKGEFITAGKSVSDRDDLKGTPIF
ncbi:MAG: hypothetical protein AB9891_05170 [Anaerolineaceae bacterium]